MHHNLELEVWFDRTNLFLCCHCWRQTPMKRDIIRSTFSTFCPCFAAAMLKCRSCVVDSTVQLTGNTCIVLKSPGSSETVSLLKEETFIVFGMLAIWKVKNCFFLMYIEPIWKGIDCKAKWYLLLAQFIRKKGGIDDAGWYNLKGLLETAVKAKVN